MIKQHIRYEVLSEPSPEYLAGKSGRNGIYTVVKLVDDLPPEIIKVFDGMDSAQSRLDAYAHAAALNAHRQQEIRDNVLLPFIADLQALGIGDAEEIDRLRTENEALKAEIARLKTRIRHIHELVKAPLDTEDERHVHMRIRKAKPAPISFLDIEDDEMLPPIAEEFCDAMHAARTDGCAVELSLIIQRWQNDELLIPQIARRIDESDWPLPERLARAHKAFMLDWEGDAYEGRHSK